MMKKLAVLALIILLVPTVSAIITHSHTALMQTNIVKQGYEFARVQGVNYRDTPVNIMHWHLSGETALVRALCELQPTIVPPGPFTTDITVQCQTKSGMTTFFPIGTKVKIDSYTPDDTPAGAFTLEKIWIEARVETATPFPISTIGHAISAEEATAAGSLLFFAGIGAIAVLTFLIIFFCLKHGE